MRAIWVIWVAITAQACSFDMAGLAPASDGHPGKDTVDVDFTTKDVVQPDGATSDGGCPPGYTRCGAVCVNLLEDFNHCGVCSNTCPSDLSDTCAFGTCVCGVAGPVCSGGLSCVHGTCECVPGGPCKGCCDQNLCVPPGPGQSVSRCGTGGMPCIACDDGDLCTDDTCAPSGGCVYTPEADGTKCDDGKYCTLKDACSSGVCTGTPRDCSSLDGACSVGVCREAQKSCGSQPKLDGSQCDDGEYCTTSDVCAAGICGGKPRDCSSLSGQCVIGVCNEAKKACVTKNLVNGSTCDDGVFCIEGETCTGGKCGGGKPRDCSHLDTDCIKGQCSEILQTCYPAPVANGTSCGTAKKASCCGGLCINNPPSWCTD